MSRFHYANCPICNKATSFYRSIYSHNNITYQYRCCGKDFLSTKEVDPITKEITPGKIVISSPENNLPVNRGNYSDYSDSDFPDYSEWFGYKPDADRIETKRLVCPQCNAVHFTDVKGKIDTDSIICYPCYSKK